MNCRWSICCTLQCLVYTAACCLVFRSYVAYVDLLTIRKLCRGINLALLDRSRDELRLVYGLGLACTAAKDRGKDPVTSGVASIDVFVTETIRFMLEIN